MDELWDCVLRGAAALDTYDIRKGSKRPWFEKMHLYQFDMASMGSCLFKRLFGNYLEGLDALSVPRDESHLFGFAAAKWSYYPTLTKLWEKIILQRLQQEVERIIAPLGCAFVDFGPLSVGEEGDNRTYYPSIQIAFPHDMTMVSIAQISTDITNRVKGISRVLMVITPKA